MAHHTHFIDAMMMMMSSRSLFPNMKVCRTYSKEIVATVAGCYHLQNPEFNPISGKQA